MRITINNNTVEVPDGSSVSVHNNEVIINGQKSSFGRLNAEQVKVVVEGNAGAITTQNASVEVKGNVTGNVCAGGSVQCGDVSRGVDAGGSVQCGSVTGNIDAGGSVSCGRVLGDIDAGGSVRHG